MPETLGFYANETEELAAVVIVDRLLDSIEDGLQTLEIKEYSLASSDTKGFYIEIIVREDLREKVEEQVNQILEVKEQLDHKDLVHFKVQDNAKILESDKNFTQHCPHHREYCNCAAGIFKLLPQNTIKLSTISTVLRTKEKQYILSTGHSFDKDDEVYMCDGAASGVNKVATTVLSLQENIPHNLSPEKQHMIDASLSECSSSTIPYCDTIPVYEKQQCFLLCEGYKNVMKYGAKTAFSTGTVCRVRKNVWDPIQKFWQRNLILFELHAQEGDSGSIIYQYSYLDERPSIAYAMLYGRDLETKHIRGGMLSKIMKVLQDRDGEPLEFQLEKSGPFSNPILTRRDTIHTFTDKTTTVTDKSSLCESGSAEDQNTDNTQPDPDPNVDNTPSKPDPNTGTDNTPPESDTPSTASITE